MSLWLLFKDELNGFYRSKVMLALWAGLPAMAVLLYFLVDDIEGMPITVCVSEPIRPTRANARNWGSP